MGEELEKKSEQKDKLEEKLKENKKTQVGETKTEEQPKEETAEEKAKREEEEESKYQQLANEMHNNGLYRMNKLELSKSNQNILVEFGVSLFEKLDEQNKQLERIANAMESKKNGN